MRKSLGQTVTAIVAGALLGVLFASVRGAALSIPLTVQELLPADDSGGFPPKDVVGRNRTNEPVTSGVPLQASDGITAVSQLAVLDTQSGKPAPAQFRVLHRYPNPDGTPCAVSDATCPIQWVLVDLQASVTANGTNTQFVLTTGANPASGTLATASASGITVNTGAAQFGMRTVDQNLLDSATAGGAALVTAGHKGGIVFVDFGGTEYRSDNDANSTAVVEENGPLRAVVKEQGRLVSSSGTISMGYTARLSFYAGKTYVRAQVSIENAFLDDVTRKQLGSIRVDVPTVLGGALNYNLATQTSVIGGALQAPADVAYLYEAFTNEGTNSNAVGEGGSFDPFYAGDGDKGAPFTSADLVLPVPPLPAGQNQNNATFPAALAGTTLTLSVDGGPDVSASFANSDFTKPSAPAPGQVAAAIQKKIGPSRVTAYWEGYYGRDPGAVVVRSLGTGPKPSIVVGNGTANAPLGLTAGQRADGQNGFQIVQNTQVLHDFGGAGEYTRGFADVSNGSGAGVRVAMRNFYSFFPDAIEFDGNGLVSVEIVSKHDTKTGMRFDWGVHETRDITLDFHAAANDPAGDFYRVQYPLFARAPFEQYRVTGGLLGRTRLLTTGQVAAYDAGNVIKGANQFIAANQANYGTTTFVWPNEQIVRHRSMSWGDGGSLTNNEFMVPKVLGFLSTGEGGLFQTAYDIGYFVVDQAVHHSDRGDRATWPAGVGGVSDLPSPPPIYEQFDGGTIETARFSGQFQDSFEHVNVLGVPMLYYLTGDQFIYEALVDLGEWLVRDHPVLVNCNPGQRGNPQAGKWEAVLWELTGDPRYKTQTDQRVDDWLCADLAGPTDADGQDVDRGFFLNGEEGRELHSPIESPVRTEGMLEVLRVLPDGDPRKAELSDRLVGFAYFSAREYYYDRNGSICNAMGWPNTPTVSSNYEYFPDRVPSSDPSAWIGLPLFDWTALWAHGYHRTHDPLFLYVGRRIVSSMGANPACKDGPNGMTIRAGRQPYTIYNGWPAQDFMWTDLHQANYSSTFENDDAGGAGGLTVVNHGNGSYTLSWTVPPGAASYQIKYGPQPMVSNLNFDKFARTYQYAPSTYDNFWAGNDAKCAGGSNIYYSPCKSDADCPGSTCSGTVTNEPSNIVGGPTPAAPGTQQSYTVSGLDPSQTYHFAMRVYTNGAAATPGVPAPTPGPTPPKLL